MNKARKLKREEYNVNSYDECEGLIYPRVSSDRQKVEGHGLESQEERCRSELSRLGVPWVKTFPDSYSGGGDFMERPAMKEMLSYIDAHPHKKYLVIFDDLKRFARDTEFHFKLRKAFMVRDVSLKCLNYNFDDSPEGRFIETILAGQGQLEREQNKRQVIQKMKTRLESGYWTFGSKKGYTRGDSSNGKIFEPNEDGKILAEALELFANRTLLRKIDVCKFLVERGFWKKQSPEKYIDKLTFILLDPFYCGDIEYKAWEVTRRKGKHEGIISSDTHERIQRILKKGDGIRRIRKNISSDFPLRGLLVCDHCGFHLNAAWTKKVFPYYLCHTKNCPKYGKSIRRKDVEDKFVILLQNSTLKSEIGVLVEIVFSRAWNQEINIFKSLELNKIHERKVLEEKALQLTDAIFNSKSFPVKNIYEKQLEDVARKIEDITTISISNTDLSIPYRTALDKAMGLLKSPYSVWCNLEVYEQHRLFFFIFEEKLSYNQESGYRTEKSPNAIRLFEDFAGVNTHDVEMAGIEPACGRESYRSLHV